MQNKHAIKYVKWYAKHATNAEYAIICRMCKNSAIKCA